jgi:hypothetical protein
MAPASRIYVALEIDSNGDLNGTDCATRGPMGRRWGVRIALSAVTR